LIANDPMTPGWRSSVVVGERLASGTLVYGPPTAREIVAGLARDPALKAEVLRELGVVIVEPAEPRGSSPF
jgi:hypothetical protein